MNTLLDTRLGDVTKISVDTAAMKQNGAAATMAYTHAGAPSNGTSGTLAGTADIGALLLDTTNAVLYQNTNTLLSPTWTALTTATGAGTYTGTFNGTVGATTPADGKFTTVEASGLVTGTAATGLTASVTQTRVGALALTKQVNVVSTVANAGDAVKLATAAVGLWMIVFNAGAHAMSVFPAGASDTIDGGAGGAAVTLTNALRALFVCVSATGWVSAQLGVVSA